MENKDEMQRQEEMETIEVREEETTEHENPEVPFETEEPAEDTTANADTDSGKSPYEMELEEKLEESNNRLLRLQADYENLRRRARQEKEADAKYRSQRLAEELLPAMDNFERALNTSIESEEAKNLMTGMEMVYRQLKDALLKEGIEEIEAVGKPFDPNFHQAVMQVEEEGFDSNTVVEELQKGYMIKDRVIRPSMVKVNS